MDTDTLKEKIIEKLKEIYDPEIPVNIYDLGLIYEIDCSSQAEKKVCVVTMTLTSAGCPVGESLVGQVANISYLIAGEENLEVHPHLVFEPQWTQEQMSDDAKLHLGML